MRCACPPWVRRRKVLDTIWCRIPDSCAERLASGHRQNRCNLCQCSGARIRLKPGFDQANGHVSGLGLDALVRYDWQLSLGGKGINPEEFARLAAQDRTLLPGYAEQAAALQAPLHWSEDNPARLLEDIARADSSHKAGSSTPGGPAVPRPPPLCRCP